MSSKYETVKMSYGSKPWFAVPAGVTRHPLNAAWLPQGGDGVIHTQDGPVKTDGMIRFFARKADLLAAIERATQGGR